MPSVPRLLPAVFAVALVAAAVVAAPAGATTPDPGTDEETVTVVLIRPDDGLTLAADRNVGDLPGVRIDARLDELGLVRAEVTPAGLAALEASGLAAEVVVDEPFRLFLEESTAIVEADDATAAGFDGRGNVVAVIDSGVDATHPAFVERIVAEACFLSAVAGICPTGGSRSTATGSGAPCVVPAADCAHGSHVAGIAASAATPFEGVAPGTGIVAIRVMRGGVVNGTAIASADVIEALDHVLGLARGGMSISAVNLSLGGGPASCDDPTTVALWSGIVADLRAEGVAVVAASGNSADDTVAPVTDVAFPACLDEVIAVGATERDETTGLAEGPAPEVADFTQYDGGLDVLAPGYEIESSVPGGGVASFSGTSMAAPHVAGALAVIDRTQSGWTSERYLELLRATGVMVERVTANGDDRHQRYPEFRLLDALVFEPFADATDGFWVIAADWAKYTGVSTGIGGNLYDPDTTLTRAQAVTLLWRLMGEPEPALPSGFTDVPEDQFYTDAVAWAAAAGVTTGTGGGLFEPDEPVTRAQVATFLWRLVGSPPFPGPTGFADVPEGEFYSQAVAWMAANGITTGTTPTTFSPDDAVSRAQMITFVWRLVNSPDAWSGGVAPPDLALF